MRVGGRYYSLTSGGKIYADTSFNSHYNGFKNKVKISYYFYSHAINESEAVEEA